MSTVLAELGGRIALKGLLGRGGMGEVHRAWDSGLERAVAVKFLRGQDQKETDRLLLEARLQARIEHPQVVRVLEVGALEGRPCIVLQLVEGASLARLAEELDLADTVEVLRQAAEGLHAAHLQGLVHRDVKPGNVLIERPPEGGPLRAFVGDFGLARDEEGGLTRTGLPAGTVDFMSPEQVLGQGPVDHRADVYALGATLYAALAGRPPFRLSGEGDPGSALQRLLQAPPPPLPPSVPRALCRVVVRALEKEPRDRYQSARELAEDLARFQRGEPVLARPAPLAERALRWARRNPVAARALGVAALAVLLGGGAAAWTSRQAGRAAMEAASFASEAQGLHQRMTLEVLLPFHDLRPARVEVRAALERAVTLDAGRRSGPAAFLEGRAHQLLGEDAAALTALERAWALGYRLPEAAYALAVAEGERFRVERAVAKAVEEPEAARRQLAEAERRWRDPALARLASLPGRGDALGRLAQVRSALLEERFADALDQARALAADQPSLVEPLELGLAAQVGLVTAAQTPGRLEEALALAELAQREGEAALATARSSVALRVSLARIDLAVLPLALPADKLGRHLDDAERRAGEALELDPDSPSALQVASEAATRRARVLLQQGRPFAEVQARGLAQAERAAALDPTAVDAWAQLAHQAINGAIMLKGAGLAVDRSLEVALASARRVRSLETGPRGALYEAQALLFRAALAQDRGEPGGADADEALRLADDAVAGGAKPLAAGFARAKALKARAKSKAFSGGDPFPDFQAAWATLRELRQRFPLDGGAAGEALDLLNDWTYQALIEGRTDVPLEEGEALGRVRVDADPADLLAAAMLGGLRMGRGLFALRAGQREAGEALYREGQVQTERLLRSPIGPAIGQGLADIALEKAWITRSAADATEAEGLIRAHLGTSPGDPDGRRFLASVLLLRAELAGAEAGGPLLDQALEALDGAAAAGMTGLPMLALRARLEERRRPGSGAASLAAARRVNPRHYLLQGLE